MSRTALERLTWYILGLGVLASIAALGLFGMPSARSVIVGAAVGLANWYLLRFIVSHVIKGNVRSQSTFTFFLFLKMIGLMGLVFVLLRSGRFEPIAFTAGMSCLVLGALLGSFVHVLTASPVKDER